MFLEELLAESIELLRRKRKIMSLITRIYAEFSQESYSFHLMTVFLPPSHHFDLGETTLFLWIRGQAWTMFVRATLTAHLRSLSQGDSPWGLAFPEGVLPPQSERPHLLTHSAVSFSFHLQHGSCKVGIERAVFLCVTELAQDRGTFFSNFVFVCRDS